MGKRCKAIGVQCFKSCGKDMTEFTWNGQIEEEMESTEGDFRET